ATRSCSSTRACCSRISATSARPSTPTRPRSMKTRTSPTVTTTSRASTSRSASRSPPSDTSDRTTAWGRAAAEASPGMQLWVGTSGYNYHEWRGSFYPEKMAAAKMLPYYAERFTTVEINYTFYRVPNTKILAGWHAETPAGFRLTLKAPKRITHIAKLRDCGELLAYFLKTAAT